LAAARPDLSFLRLPVEGFAALPALSIGDALMEHTERCTVVPVNMGCSEVASWSAVLGNSTRDGDGNALVGDAVGIDNRGCYIRSDSCLVAAVGLRDMVVVVTDDAVLVADKHRDHEVKALVEGLKGRGRPEVANGPRCYRPWGWFDTVDRGERFQVKHIHVNAGARLSLQKHWHRSEHWVVVTGTAVVTKGDEVTVLRENQSTYIPAGTVHRLENPGRLPLKLIEVQSGEYVGEDDIVRLDDSYGR
jgi:mannose-1-phosphate guanylyltransferase / mannose-6-phosphate isomerase